MEVKIEDRYCSSDMSQDKIIYTDMNGGIHHRNYKLKTRSEPRYIKYYSGDTSVYTTTGESGLEVFDGENGICVYCYTKERLLDHIYDDMNRVVSYGDKIYFYDLRMRYSGESIDVNGIEKIYGRKREIYFLRNTQIGYYDIDRNKIIWSESTDGDILFMDQKIIVNRMDGCHTYRYEDIKIGNSSFLFGTSERKVGMKLLYSMADPETEIVETGKSVCAVKDGGSPLEINGIYRGMHEMYFVDGEYFVFLDDKYIRDSFFYS